MCGSRLIENFAEDKKTIVYLASLKTPHPILPSQLWSGYNHTYLSKLRRDSIGADFQSVRKLTNYFTSEAQTKKSIADIGISAPSAKLI